MTTYPKRRPRRHWVDISTTDRAFDELVPADLRHLSQTHWTPVDVAIRAASLLGAGPRSRILDIGSGVGKLSVVGAMSSPALWFGIEQHEPLVVAARSVARSLRVADRTMFVHGDAFSIDWSEFDAIYLYNPFEVPLFGAAGTGRANDVRAQVAQTQGRLASLPAGTLVLTLHGFGGVMPASFELVYQERVPIVALDLVLWIQRSRTRRALEAS